MAQNSPTQGFYQLPESLSQDLEKLHNLVARLKEGAISAAKFRAFRVPLGVYEQRQENTYMLRVRLPAGGLLPGQMRVLADVSRTYGNGILHVTTRQDIQVHSTALNDIHPALVQMVPVGLSTKGGGGNTVRNVTACSDAGVCSREPFDVSPYAVALTEFLLPDPLSFQLPRKYKIAFSGCSRDCAGATVNDLGFIARTKNGQVGFAAYVGGGLGAKSRVGRLFQEFVPAAEIHLMADAIKRVFDQHGNRKNKHQARLRFLIEQIGMDRFRELYDTELAKLRKEKNAPLQVCDLPRRDPAPLCVEEEPADGFADWRDTNTATQEQAGYRLVQIPLSLGDISADTIEKLAEVIENHGEGMLRTTQSQNLVLRWVSEKELPAVHRRLSEIGLAETPPPVLRDLVPCAGAATCRLGICLSRGLATAIREKLIRTEMNLAELGEVNIHISGCPNSCGRHPVGRIGFFGAARRVSGHLVPHYVFQVGGKVEEGATRLAEGKLALPARNVPALVCDFLQAFRESPEFPDYETFLNGGGGEVAAQLVAQHDHVPAFDEDKNYYYDWSADALFSLAGRGPGECGAGVFDLIEVDLASAQEAVQSGKLRAATVLAARALLVTQGQEAKDDADALRLFTTHFVDHGLVQESFKRVLQDALQSVSADASEEGFETKPEEVCGLVDAVQALYESMDQSLRFPSPAQKEEAQPGTSSSEEPAGEETPKIDREEDFRGVACPLNYVKTKLILEQMASGEVLSVLLDAEGARNVPQSTTQDGHEVLGVAKEDGHWRVTIRKS